MSRLTELEMHRFARDVLENADAVRRLLVDDKPLSIEPEFKREPDEHEFFLLRTSHSLIGVLNCCRQLAQIPVYLNNHHQTPAMRKTGINRHGAIVYHLENYIIRTRSLLDRVLKLVDAVFHLTNEDRNCRYGVVIQNVKVQVSEVPNSIEGLKQLLDRYSGTRNRIIHDGQFDDDALRRLEFYFLIERWESVSPKATASKIREQIQDHIHEILWFKKKEFLAFNEEIATSIEQIFDKLTPYYVREEKALRLRLVKPTN